MGNERKFVEVPPSRNSAADGIRSFETAIEPVEHRETFLSEEIRPLEKNKTTLFFLLSLLVFLLLIIVVGYILFRNYSIDTKLNRIEKNDLRPILEQIDFRLKSIERIFNEQNEKFQLNFQLSGKDLREFSSNQTQLVEMIRRLKTQL